MHVVACRVLQHQMEGFFCAPEGRKEVVQEGDAKALGSWRPAHLALSVGQLCAAARAVRAPTGRAPCGARQVQVCSRVFEYGTHT